MNTGLDKKLIRERRIEARRIGSWNSWKCL